MATVVYAMFALILHYPNANTNYCKHLMSKFLSYFLQRKTSLKSLSSCTFHYNRSTPIDRHHRQTASPIAMASRTVASNTVRLSHESQNSKNNKNGKIRYRPPEKLHTSMMKLYPDTNRCRFLRKLIAVRLFT